MGKKEEEELLWEMINFELGETLEYLKDLKGVWGKLTSENRKLILHIVSGSLHLEFAEWISSLCISNFKSGGTWYLPDGSFKTTEQLWKMFLKQRQ